MKFGIRDKVFTRPTLSNFTLTDTIELRYFEKWQHCEKKLIALSTLKIITFILVFPIVLK